MATLNEIYKCEICGNVIEVIEAHEGTLVCCGKDMILQIAKTKKHEGNEKHVPILTIDKNIISVKVGSIPHPMTEKHFIELIEIVQNGKVIASKRLSPLEKPEAKFYLSNAIKLTARAYCNIHFLWIS